MVQRTRTNEELIAFAKRWVGLNKQNKDEIKAALENRLNSESFKVFGSFLDGLDRVGVDELMK